MPEIIPDEFYNPLTSLYLPMMQQRNQLINNLAVLQYNSDSKTKHMNGSIDALFANNEGNKGYGYETLRQYVHHELNFLINSLPYSKNFKKLTKQKMRDSIFRGGAVPYDLIKNPNFEDIMDFLLEQFEGKNCADWTEGHNEVVKGWFGSKTNQWVPGDWIYGFFKEEAPWVCLDFRILELVKPETKMSFWLGGLNPTNQFFDNFLNIDLKLNNSRLTYFTKINELYIYQEDDPIKVSDNYIDLFSSLRVKYTEMQKIFNDYLNQLSVGSMTFDQALPDDPGSYLWSNWDNGISASLMVYEGNTVNFNDVLAYVMGGGHKPVHLWSLQGITSTNTIEDLTDRNLYGNEYNCVVSSSEKKFGDYSMKFNGTNSYIEFLGIKGGYYEKFTITLWFKEDEIKYIVTNENIGSSGSSSYTSSTVYQHLIPGSVKLTVQVLSKIFQYSVSNGKFITNDNLNHIADELIVLGDGIQTVFITTLDNLNIKEGTVVVTATVYGNVFTFNSDTNGYFTDSRKLNFKLIDVGTGDGTTTYFYTSLLKKITTSNLKVKGNILDRNFVLNDDGSGGFTVSNSNVVNPSDVVGVSDGATLIYDKLGINTNMISNTIKIDAIYENKKFTYKDNGIGGFIIDVPLIYTNENIGTGTGSNILNTNTDNTSIKPSTLIIKYYVSSILITASDNGSGIITGGYIVTATVNYDTGAIFIQLNTGFTSGTPITATYQSNILDLSNSMINYTTGDVHLEFLVSPTIGENINIQYGINVLDLGTSSIDYDTGDLTLNFYHAPKDGTKLYCDYEISILDITSTNSYYTVSTGAINLTFYNPPDNTTRVEADYKLESLNLGTSSINCETGDMVLNFYRNTTSDLFLDYNTYNKEGKIISSKLTGLPTNDTQFYVGQVNGKLRLQLNNNIKDFNYTQYQWNFLVMKFDINGLSVYLNNYNTPEATISNIAGFKLNNLYLGGGVDIGSEFYKGYMEDFEFFNAPISKNRFGEIYNNGNGNSTFKLTNQFLDSIAGYVSNYKIIVDHNVDMYSKVGNNYILKDVDLVHGSVNKDTLKADCEAMQKVLEEYLLYIYVVSDSEMNKLYNGTYNFNSNTTKQVLSKFFTSPTDENTIYSDFFQVRTKLTSRINEAIILRAVKLMTHYMFTTFEKVPIIGPDDSAFYKKWKFYIKMVVDKNKEAGVGTYFMLKGQLDQITYTLIAIKYIEDCIDKMKGNTNKEYLYFINEASNIIGPLVLPILINDENFAEVIWGEVPNANKYEVWRQKCKHDVTKTDLWIIETPFEKIATLVPEQGMTKAATAYDDNVELLEKGNYNPNDPSSFATVKRYYYKVIAYCENLSYFTSYLDEYLTPYYGITATDLQMTDCKSLFSRGGEKNDSESTKLGVNVVDPAYDKYKTYIDL